MKIVITSGAIFKIKWKSFKTLQKNIETLFYGFWDLDGKSMNGLKRKWQKKHQFKVKKKHKQILEKNA